MAGKSLDENLNDRQLKFAKEYCLDLNKTQAAIRAGYSDKHARSYGSLLYANPNIKAKIEELLQEQLMPKSEILRRLESIADQTDPEDIKDAINRERNRIRALELLGKYHLLFTDNNKPQDINVNVQVDGLENLLSKVYGSNDDNSDD